VSDIKEESKVLQNGCGLTCDLDVERRVEQEVLCLEVAVDDVLGVAVGDGGHDLLEAAPRLTLIHPPVRNQVI
jgi:hypothetical protein